MRKLKWGPFIVSMVATALIARGLWWVCAVCWGHWRFWPLAVVSTGIVALLGGSGVAALRTKPKVDYRTTPSREVVHYQNSGGQLDTTKLAHLYVIDTPEGQVYATPRPGWYELKGTIGTPTRRPRKDLDG